MLLELGWVEEAEAETLRVLDARPDDRDALSLYAKIKHLRGELSQAIACWARLHAGSPHNETVIMELELLVREPNRRVGFVPSEALAQVLAMVRYGDFETARGASEVLVSELVGGDPGELKIAALAAAWIAQLAGDVDAACAQLEQLGEIRGFEYDLDRLLALARCYERRATPGSLEASGRLYRHLVRDLEHRGIEKLSLIGKLADLERRGGNLEIAADLDRRFLAGVRRRMHRPSLHEAVRVAAAEYLPLARLRRLRAEGPTSQPTRRETALVQAIHGELRHAAMLFADGGDPIDRCYLGELAADDGDHARAVELFASAIEAGADSLHAIEWLADHDDVRATELWSSETQRRRAIALLEASRELAPARPETWRRLSALYRLDGRPDEALACAVRASATHAIPPGRVLAASVYHFIGKAKGLLHEIWVHRHPTERGRGGTLAADDIHGNVTPELRAAIRNTFISVREYVRAKFPHAATDIDDWTYTYKLPKEDEPSGGVSAGLPSALAFLSVFLQQPVPHAIASSGALIAEAHDVITVGKIGEADYKVKAAYYSNLDMLILPLANRPDLERSTIVPREIIAEVVHYVNDLDQVVKLVFGANAFTRA